MQIAYGCCAITQAYLCNDAVSKEKEMDLTLHILGIVFYTVALVHLVSEHIQKHKDEE